MEWITRIGGFFAIDGQIISVEPHPNGLINKSFLLTTTEKRYLVQRINHYVFKKPPALMDNIEQITNHLAKNGRQKVILKIIKTLDGKNYLKDQDQYYRIYEYIENCYSYFTKPPEKAVYQMGKCVGRFQKNLLDFDIRKLRKNFEGFHNTLNRYQNLVNSYQQASLELRIKCQKEYDQLSQNHKLYGMIEQALNQQLIPYRVIHNDTKFNNIMFDKVTNQAVCLVDLDTVSVGSCLYDYADSLRILASTCLEDDQRIELIDFDIKAFIKFTIGYLSQMKTYLNKKEVSLMGLSIYLITCECGIRFLTDYLENNRYFKIEYPLHNLVRARNQISFAEKLYQQLPLIKKIINNLYHRI